jgi:hypothetical protein
MHHVRIASIFLAALLVAPVYAAGTSPFACGALPTGGVYATFKIGGETFRASITSPTGVNDAIALWRGRSNKTIPVGKLNCAQIGWNCPWHWHMAPASVTFAQSTVEVCQGLPSHVEANCPGFAMGTYCAAGAVMTELRDCRSSFSCPRVPR